jgi:hypothetical protein
MFMKIDSTVTSGLELDVRPAHGANAPGIAVR